MDINSFRVEKIIQVLGKGKPKRHMKMIDGQKPLANSTNSSHPKYASVITHNVRNHFFGYAFYRFYRNYSPKVKTFFKRNLTCVCHLVASCPRLLSQ